jgi:hypothetical protein
VPFAPPPELAPAQRRRWRRLQTDAILTACQRARWVTYSHYDDRLHAGPRWHQTHSRVHTEKVTWLTRPPA